MRSLYRYFITLIEYAIRYLAARLDARSFNVRPLYVEDTMKRLNSSFKNLASDIGKDGSKL